MLAYLLYNCIKIVDTSVVHWKHEQKVDTFAIQGCWWRKKIYIFGNVAFYTFKCYKKKGKTKKQPFIALNAFVLVVVKE